MVDGCRRNQEVEVGDKPAFAPQAHPRAGKDLHDGVREREELQALKEGPEVDKLHRGIRGVMAPSKSSP